MSKSDPHIYTSIACIHEQHARCVIQCRYCDAVCDCECHDPGPEVEPTAGLETRDALELVSQ